MSEEYQFNPLSGEMDIVGGVGDIHAPFQAEEGNIPMFGSSPDELEDSGINADDVLVKHYGVCFTAANVAAKTVNVAPAEFRSLTGDRVVVHFVHANTASNPTLAVGDLPAKVIYANGVAITDGNSKTLLMGVCEFIYDGQEWNLMGNHINTIADVSPVIDAALNNLNGEIEAVDPENTGDIHCSGINMDDLPKVCGYPLIYFGADSPARTPDFVGQFYISGWSFSKDNVLVASGSAVHVYMALGVANAASYVRLDN